jgi:hypothetical protein
MITEKKCAKCHRVLPVDCFYPDLKSANGYASYCRQCKGIKDEVRYSLPALDPMQWQKLFCYRVTCVRCGTATDVSLYRDGVKLPKPTTIEEAKANARSGDVYCAKCVDVHEKGLQQTLRLRNRRNEVEERIKETDFELDTQIQMKKPYLKKLKRVGKEQAHKTVLIADAKCELHDNLVDTYMKRHADKQTQDDLNERLPVITEHKGRTVRHRENMSYDQIYEYWGKLEEEGSHD